jgi:KUP system potassium uptake protein
VDGGIVLLGVFACALFYGDSMITPAISVLSAVEGLTTVESGFAPYVSRSRSASWSACSRSRRAARRKVGALFGPIMLLYFLTIGARRDPYRRRSPMIVLQTINPLNAVRFFAGRRGSPSSRWARSCWPSPAPRRSMPTWAISAASRSAILAVLRPAGADAQLYGPGRDDPVARPRARDGQDPFFLLAPESASPAARHPRHLATIIASQAVISGAFSVTQQAIQLGFIPRLRIEHTSASAAGQIYIPVINWALMVMVILLVLTFRPRRATSPRPTASRSPARCSSTPACSRRAVRRCGSGSRGSRVPLLASSSCRHRLFRANLTKVPDGGWFPLLVGFIAFTLLTTWAKGRQLMIEADERGGDAGRDLHQVRRRAAPRVPGTAVFMTTAPDGVPHALLHNLKHNKVLHERVMLLTVEDRGRALCRGGEDASTSTISARASTG